MDSSNDIAIVGMGIHVPGAHSASEFWNNLRDGVESVEFLSDAELRSSGVPEHELANPNYIKAGAYLDGVGNFDAEFFGLSPKEAAIMDPQHRHFLEVCWEALEHAGHPPEKFPGRIGVFGGCGMGTYMMYNLLTNPELMRSVGYFAIRHTGNDKDFLTTRVSYALNLDGPSIGVQTACSTSLVAVHVAAQSLLLGECDMALAGGVTIELPHRRGYVYRKLEILSPDGHCRAFDHRSEGTIFGSGAGVVALRRYEDAERDGDEIHAVIKGSAVNNDGSTKAGYLAPSVTGQAQAVSEALSVADVPAHSISYVEAHGTGTPIGDPIEIAALSQAYKMTTDSKQFCAIGSVKTNIGHLDTAAGVIGLIKTTLALKHRQIPPSLNWEAPNPTIDFENSPFFVNHELREWQQAATPRRAGVNSLGVGGTNAHIILEEVPDRPRSPIGVPDRPFLVRLSARTPAALHDNSTRLADFLQQHSGVSLADVETTLRDGRADFQHRRVFACRSVEEAIELLETNDPYRVFTHVSSSTPPVPVFLLPGGGAQYAGMATGLYEAMPEFRTSMLQCLQIASDNHGVDIKSLIFGSRTDPQIQSEFERPSRQLPAIFAVEYALARLWISRGVTPGALLGHSMGETTAACLAGVLSLEDALGLICLRGQLFETLPEGGMVSVAASEQDLQELKLLGDELAVAVVNAPGLCVVSGPACALNDFCERLASHEIDGTRIPITIAAHSPMLDPILGPFRERLKQIELQRPTIPFLSNLTGTWITDAQATDPNYWVDHLRSTVHFGACLATLMEDLPECLLLETGPGTTLTSLAKLQPTFTASHHAITSLRHRDQDVSDVDAFVTALGRVWASGAEFDESTLDRDGSRITLPTYSFQHRHYWIEPGSAANQQDLSSSMLHRTDDFDDWFFAPRWEKCELTGPNPSPPKSWLVLSDELGVGDALSVELQAAGHSVVRVDLGDRNAKIKRGEYTVRADGDVKSYEQLAQRIVDDGHPIDGILNLWTLTGREETRSASDQFAENLHRSFYRPFFLLQALGNRDELDHLRILTVSNGARQVFDEDVPFPEKATLDGPCRVAVHEYTDVTATTLDVDFELPNRDSSRGGQSSRSDDVVRLAKQLHGELRADATNTTVAYRDGQRYELRYVKSAAEPTDEYLAEPICDGDTFLITGGVGGIGLVIAEALARRARVNLLLLSRSGLPHRDEWDARLNDKEQDRVSAAIRSVRRLESLGSTVEIGAVDVTDLEGMRQFVGAAEHRFGPIRGVVHAAGVINDSLIAVKTIDEVTNVFAPKIHGTQVLDAIFCERPLDFFVVFSSVSSIMAPLGQIDYVAANAFLNAYVQSRQSSGRQRYINLTWGVWNETGMAAEAMQSTDISARPAKHVMFREVRDTPNGKRIALAPLSPSTHWMIDEHRLADDRALMPGTSVVDIVAEALAEIVDCDACEIRDLQFISPLAVGASESQRARVKLERKGDHFGFEVQSLRKGADGRYGWLTHSQGEVAQFTEHDRRDIDLEAVRDRCRESSVVGRETGLQIAQATHLRLGPRWQSLRELHYGQREAFAKLELPTEFREDLRDTRIHPALLDIATGCAMNLIDGYDASTSVLWVPVSYGRIQVYEALPAQIVSWIRSRGENRIGCDSASFDVTICDPSGRILIDIEDFTIQTAPHGDLLASLRQIPATALESERASAASNLWDAELDPATRTLVHNVSQGILAEEGMHAFNRVIDRSAGGEVVISSLDVNALCEQTSRLSAAKQPNEMRFERPDLDSDYEPPSSETERRLVEFWQEVLGIQNIGIHDNFFSLGGHSLLATRIRARIASTFKIELSLRDVFEARTVVDLAAIIDAQRSSRSSTEDDDPRQADAPDSDLQPVDREQLERLPLSFSQQRLWFLEQMESELVAYNLPFAWRVRGGVDVEALRRALQQIVQRHEPLRTTFQMVDRQPQQTVETIERFELPMEDLRSIAPEQRDGEIERRCRAEAIHPFDLNADLMLRAQLLQLADDDHVLLLTMHHIATDAWSLELLWRELERRYQHAVEGTDPDLPDLPVQYVDYAIWQRQRLQEKRLDPLLDYWREQLDGITPLELPTDRPRPAALTYHAAGCNFELDEALVDRLQALGRNEGATLQMTLLAAFQVLLARYSGQQDIAVGTPIAGRIHERLEKQIGFFVNTLVLRTDLSQQPTFRQLLGRVRQISLAAYDHQELPFEKIVEDLQPERQLNRSPLIQVLFQLLEFSHYDLTFSDLDVKRVFDSDQRVRFDLEMQLLRDQNRLRGTLLYSTQLFDAATIERMAGHFVSLLHAIVDDADRRITELPMLTESEKGQLLTEWNDAAVESPDVSTVHQMFERQVAQTPGAIAVVFENQQLTYRELNEKANQLAHHLRGLSVGPDTLVGLCLERSIHLPISILAILKAGAAYVPLDADFPEQRIQFMMQDAAVQAVVTQSSLRDRIRRAGGSDQIVDIDVVQLAAHERTAPDAGVRSDNLAYVMYTSGSTGEPKGVAMPHSSLVNLIEWHRRDARLGRPSRTLQFASYSFDVSFQELLTTWCTGGTIVLISEEVRRDPRLLWDTIVDCGVDRLFMPYIALQHVATLDAGNRGQLRDIVSAGEALQLTPEIRQLVRNHPGCRLHNHFGPTETHVVTSYLLDESTDDWPTESPIGRPIANTQVYVLDAHRQLTPIGVPGELYLGGAGLARGYLNRPELTVEKFVRNPFDADLNAKLYRTGDQVRWRSDGNLEFLGRLDDQVKIRGYRVELGEIEAVLHEHADVAQSVVVVREDRPGDKRLVGYCVAAADHELDVSELIRFLRSRLPEYMVPATIIALDAIPLTPSGKMDRRDLPAPSESRPDQQVGYVAPRNSSERQLAAIWCELLGIEKLGVHDNFFSAGGHSLLVARMVELVNQSFSDPLTIASVFRTPTIAELASHLGQSASREELVHSSKKTKRNGRFLTVLREGCRAGSIVCVGGNVIEQVSRMPAEASILHLAIEGVQTESYRGGTIPEVAVEYAEELLAEKLVGPIVLLGYSYGGVLAHALAHCLRNRHAIDSRVVLVEPTVSLKVRYAQKARPVGRRIHEFASDPKAQLSPIVRSARLSINLGASRTWIGIQMALGRPVTTRQRWKYYLKAIHKRIESYEPSMRLSATTHLVCGQKWLNEGGREWTDRFLQEPITHNAGDVRHLDLMKTDVLTAYWLDVVSELCPKNPIDSSQAAPLVAVDSPS